jgi:hypothetical protein
MPRHKLAPDEVNPPKGELINRLGRLAVPMRRDEIA